MTSTARSIGASRGRLATGSVPAAVTHRRSFRRNSMSAGGRRHHTVLAVALLLTAAALMFRKLAIGQVRPVAFRRYPGRSAA